MLEGKYKLDGRVFDGISHSLSANQDDYIVAHLRLAGALEVLQDIDGVKRSPEKRAEDLLTKILLAGKTHYVLAGCLTEEGAKWSRESADRNAERFAALTDPIEKTVMREYVVEFVAVFFSFVARSSTISRKSSRPNGKDRRTKSAAR